MSSSEPVYSRQQLRLRDAVDLVEEEDRGGGEVAQDLHQIVVTTTATLRGIDDHGHQIDIEHRLARRLHHATIHAVVRTVHPWRIDEDGLPAILGQDSADAMPRCLWLARHDRDLGAD